MGHQVTGVGDKATAEKAREEPPRRVIPIVFVPGIAGSNLRVRGGKEIEELVRKRINEPDETTKPGKKFLPDDEPLPDPWRPPNGPSDPGAIPCINRWDNYGPVQRQALLNSETTCVDDRGFLIAGARGWRLSPTTRSGRIFRGWNSLHLDSYLGILTFLESECNEPRDAQSSKLPPMKDRTADQLSADLRILVDCPWSRERKMGLEEFGLSHCRLPLDKVLKIFECQMSVYAVGYNWLDSNAVSAQALLAKTERIIKLYKEAKGDDCSPLYTCEKVILVTHSMGGLVARAAAHLDNSRLFLGIVHGVMPAVGTPSAYQRMVSGVEGSLDREAIAATYRDGVVALMGRSTDRTTPVLANNAGPLQLLPSKEYPPRWLECAFHRDNGTADPILKLPEIDPYKEIYEQKEAWYRLVNPALIDPCKAHINSGIVPWEHYMKMIGLARDFHENLKINQKKRPETFAFYGKDPYFSTLGTIRWHLVKASQRIHVTRALLLNAKSHREHYNPKNGRVSRVINKGVEFDKSNFAVSQLTFESQGPDTMGDGTVSWQSGSAPDNTWLKGKVQALKGLDHQKAFDCVQARWYTLWGICKILDAKK